MLVTGARGWRRQGEILIHPVKFVLFFVLGALFCLRIGPGCLPEGEADSDGCCGAKKAQEQGVEQTFCAIRLLFVWHSSFALDAGIFAARVQFGRRATLSVERCLPDSYRKDTGLLRLVQPHVSQMAAVNMVFG